MSSDRVHHELGGFERRLLEELTERDAARPTSPPTRPRLSHRWRRHAVLLGAAGVAVIVGGATATASALFDRPDLAVVSTDAYPGGPLLLKGSGCGSGAAVEIRLDDATLGAASAGPDGYFSADLAIPNGTAMGRHTITVSCMDGAEMSSQRLTITVTERPPAPPMPPDFAIGGAAIPHGQVVVKGSGCQPGTTVTFRVAGFPATESLGTADVDAGGAYTAILPVSGLQVGEHALVASCPASAGGTLDMTGSLHIVEPAEAGETGAKPTPR